MPRQQEATRIARKTYAIQFFKYFVQRPSQAAAVVQGQADAQDAQAEDGGPSNRQEINIGVQDHLTLYPLIQKDANLATECHKLGSNRYCIQDKRSVATVLYVSDEIPLPDQYYTSNTSFRELNQFIIPIEDPTQPIRIQCTPEDYSILFTMSQGDDYKDGFRCHDLMYYG